MSKKSHVPVPSLQEIARKTVRQTLQEQAKTATKPLSKESQSNRDFAKYILKNTPIEIEDTKRSVEKFTKTTAAKKIQRNVKDKLLQLNVTQLSEYPQIRYEPSVKAKFENKKLQFILNSNSMYFNEYTRVDSIKNAAIIGKNMVKIELDRFAPRVRSWANTYIIIDFNNHTITSYKVSPDSQNTDMNVADLLGPEYMTYRLLSPLEK